MKKIKITDLLIFIITAELTGALSALFSGGNFKEYYSILNRPPIAPPAWVFPIAWGLLYALMGTAAYFIYISGSELRHTALKLYILQLFVNFLWSPVFFGAGSLIGAAVIAVILLALVILTAVFFGKISEVSVLLFAPYVVWTAYALYLTIGFLVLNR
ncbi:MAG: tryptophan-rich sensory protein [Ruminococcus sp.]|nr:tryptophan-rich sensory protein [Ruminococcus sp.]